MIAEKQAEVEAATGEAKRLRELTENQAASLKDKEAHAKA
jgi:hypothetical protein